MSNQIDRMKGGRRKRRILLVEDDRATAEMLLAALSDPPFEVSFKVRWVDTAAEAIRILTRCSSGRDWKECPDLVLLDLMLPDSFSREMLMQLSHVPNLPPVIVVSAKPHPYIEDAAQTIGAAAVLQKPFALDSMWEQIRPLIL